MKTLRSLMGLALLASGLYLSYLAFSSLNELEPTILALYLVSAFVLMTLGLYLTLLFFLSQKEVKNFKESLEEALDISDRTETQEQLEKLQENLEDDQAEIDELKENVAMIENTMVLNLFEEKVPEPEAVKEVSKPEVNEDLGSNEEPSLQEPIVVEKNQADTESLLFNETYDEESTQTLKNFFGEETKDPENDVYSTESIDARLIGIESWTLQNRLKKIPEGSECSLQINTKQGLKSAEIYHEKTHIGYLSKVDYNKMEDKLPKLYTIKIQSKIFEQKKLSTVILRFSFKD